jgi:integrase
MKLKLRRSFPVTAICGSSIRWNLASFRVDGETLVAQALNSSGTAFPDHDKSVLDSKMYRQGGKRVNETFFKLRLIVLVALTTGMRISAIFGLKWSDVQHREGLIAVRAKLKGGKMR